MENEATKVSLKEAVKKMRFWQKMYFKTKSPSALQDSKRWENEVDRLLLEGDQPGLFDNVDMVKRFESHTVRIELSDFFLAKLLENDATAMDVFVKDFIRSVKKFVYVPRLADDQKEDR